MNLPGLISPTAEQMSTVNALAAMMGEAFLEENWTRALLDPLDDLISSDRKLFISQEIMRLDFIHALPYSALYATPDLVACAGAYLKSELQGKSWASIENESAVELIETVLTDEEREIFLMTQATLAPVSVFDWEEAEAQRMGCADFIHFYDIGVNKKARGQGSFRRLIEPFFDYADTHALPCFLETYSDQLEKLYKHFGFETVRSLHTSRSPLVERCMVRLPT